MSVVSEYTILETDVEEYDRLVLCLSFESILTYIKQIEHTLAKDDVNKKILLDQLLITGNGTNRFMSFRFENGILDTKTARVVNPTEYYRMETVKWLHNNYHYVENSILTVEQKQKIKDNIAF